MCYNYKRSEEIGKIGNVHLIMINEQTQSSFKNERSFIMPQTKFQDVIFGIIMVIFMVFAMVTYNIAINDGGLSYEVFLTALKALPVTCLIAFLIEFFFVGKIVKIITFKVLDAKQTQPIFITLMISCLTVAFMCPIMTLVANIFFEFKGWENLFVNWIQTWTLSFPMALFWQLFYAGPAVRFIFRQIFKKSLKASK